MRTRITDRIGTLLRLTLFILGFHSVMVNAAPAIFMYQGRIIDSAGKPLEYGSVSFEFTILSPDGSCVLYKEQINNVDMRNSKGVFETAIGTGVKSYPATPSFSLLDAFSNAAPLTCSGGTPFTPLESSGRVLRVQFFDGKGWQLVTPDSVIRSVPYAGFASSADRLGTHPIGDFVMKPTSCTAGQVIGFDGTGFTCTTNGATNGTLTSISSANSYLTVTNPTSTPVLTVNVGTSAGTVAAGNDARFTDARTPTGTAGGDLVGSYPNPTVAQLQGRPFSNAAPTDGQAVLWDAGNNTWKPQFVRMQDIRNQWGGSTMIPSTACASNEAMVWSVLTDRFTCQAISLNGSAITAGTINPARLGTGTADNTTYLRGDGTWAATPTVTETDPKVGANTTNYLSKWNGTALVASGVFENSGSVGIGTASPGNLLDVQKNQGAMTYVSVRNTHTGGGAGSAYYNDQGLTGEVTVAGSAAGAPWQNRLNLYSYPTAGGINIATSGSGDDIRFFTDTETEAARILSSGNFGIGTATPGAKLEVAGQVKITGGTPGVGKVLTSDAAGLATWTTPAAGNPGTVTTVSSTNSYLTVANGSSTPALTLNVGTAANTVAAGNDSRFTDSRAPSGAAGGDLSGSYPNPTVAKVQGTAVSATAPTSAGQVLRYNGTTSWVAGFLSLADIRSSVTPANTMFPTTSCTAAETLTWSSLTDTMGCTTIGIVATQVTSGTLAAARMPAFTGDVTSTVNTTALTIANNAVTSAKILDGTITSADLASTLTDTLWTASSGHVYRSSGNVGIGTTAPNSLLHLLASGTNAGTHLEMQNTDAGGRDWRISTGGSSGAVPAGKFAITDVTASTVRMTIDSSGNMGIGTTNPSTRLHVASASGSSIVRNEAGSGGIAYFLGYRPGAVAGDSLARFEARPTEMTDGNGASISFRSTETPGATAAAGTAIDFFSRANGGTNSSNRMTIDHNGNVGIGTTSPGYSLDLQSTTGSIAATRTMASAVGPDIYLQKDRGSVGSPAAVQNGDALGHLNFRGYDGTNYIRGARISSLVSAAPATNQLSAFLAFFTNDAGADATERMRITSTGNVGIGTTAPAYEVDVVGDARVSGEFISTNSNQARFISGNYGVIHRNDGTNYYLLLTASGDQYGSWNTLRPLTITTSTGNIQMGNNVLNVQHGGNVGIGTTTPAEKLEVSGNVKATNFISTSDRRLKKDIQPIEGLSAILKLNGVKYRWIKDNAPDGGVIAQEVEAVFPEAVRTDANTGMKGVKYQFLFGPLIESTKELYGMCKETQETVKAQDRRIASVEEENAQLKKTTEELKKENDDLKKRLEAIEKHLGISK